MSQQVTDESTKISNQTTLRIRADEFKNARWAMIHGWYGVVLGLSLYFGGVVFVGCIGAIVLSGALFSLEGIVGIFMTTIATGAFSAVGLMLGLFWSTVVLCSISAFDTSLGKVISPRMAVRIFGCTAGFFSLFWPSIFFLSESNYISTSVVALYAVIIFGAMVAGQVGGLWWAAYHDAWRIPKRKISSAIDDEETVRFGIRHILIAMFIFSLVFTGDAFFASRFKSHAPLIFFAVFVFGQLVLIVGDRTLTKWGRENRASKIAAKEARTKEARTQLSS